MSEIIVYCDGWTHDGGGCSVAIFSGKRVVHKRSYEIKDLKNFALKAFVDKNIISVPVSEYFAVYTALRVLRSQAELLKEERVIIYSDSQLIVYQLNGYWEVNNYVLTRWNHLCKKLKPDNTDILWISRTRIKQILGH